MALSLRAKKGIFAFGRQQQTKYHLPQLDAHEKALKINARFDIEKSQREKRYGIVKS